MHFARTCTSQSASRWLPILGAVALCAMSFLSLAGSARAADVQSHAPLIVESVHGDVRATAKGSALALKPGTVIELPASLYVGSNSDLELHQGQTIIAAAANSQLDIPLAAGTTDTLERVIQSKGNVFYNVAKRQGKKLRVETPYLVAVIKGTQFNVAAQDLAATISLFEGRLEVHATDESDVVDLEAGYIAVRSNLAPAIRVLNMDTGATLRAGVVPDAAPSTASKNHSASPSAMAAADDVRPATIDVAGGASSIALPVETSTHLVADDHGVSSTLALNDLVAHASVSPADTIASTSTGTIATGAGSNANISAPGAAIGSGSNANAGSGGGSNLNTGLNTGAGTNINVNAGGALNSGINAGSGAGNGGASAAANTGVSVGAGTGTAVSAGASLGAGTGTAVNAGATLGAGAGTSVNAGANAGAGNGGLNVNLNAGLGGTNLDASLGTSGVGLGVTTGSGNNNGNGSSNSGSNSSGTNSGNSSSNSGSNNSGSNSGSGTLAGLLKSLTKNKGK